MTPQRAILFLAVSSEAQAADDRESLPEQRRALDEAAARFNWRVVDVIEIPGLSRSHWTWREFCETAAVVGVDDPARMWDHWKRRDFDVLAAVTFSRLGREQSIMAEVIGRTIDAGAQVYAVQGGWIDAGNYRPMTAFASLNSSVEKDELGRRHKFGMQGRARRGIPARLGLTHSYVFDARGKPTGAVVNEANRRLFDDLYDLMVFERTPYNDLEMEMAARGHCDTDGRAFKPAKFYRLLHAPLTWGITHYGAGRAGQHAYGKWVYGAAPPPDGAVIVFDAVPPVWTGEQADRLIAELKRRPLMVGSARPRSTRAFTGVFVCASCGHTMSVLHPGRGNSQIRCNGKYKKPPHCTARNAIFEDAARAFFSGVIHAFLQGHGIVELDAPPDHSATLERIANERAAILDELDALIVTQARAHTAARERYQARIDALGVQLDALDARRDQLTFAAEQQSRQRRKRATLTEQLDATKHHFWELPEPVINQALLEMLGDNRVIVQPGHGEWAIRVP